MKTLVAIPTYNERENIEELCRRVLGQPGAFSVLVVDDASPDGTGAVVRRLAADDARIRLLSRPSKQGLGTAYIAAFREALAGKFDGEFDGVVQMDADHDPASLGPLVAASRDHDVVGLGCRASEKEYDSP
jgi:dolichol-phosphate mannosyltransferase